MRSILEPIPLVVYERLLSERLRAFWMTGMRRSRNVHFGPEDQRPLPTPCRRSEGPHSGFLADPNLRRDQKALRQPAFKRRWTQVPLQPRRIWHLAGTLLKLHIPVMPDPLRSASFNVPNGRTSAPVRPLHRFCEFVPLSAPEMAEVCELADRPVALPRGAVIIAQGVEPTCVHLLIEGWASASVDLEDGTRQIAKVHLPGDLIGMPNMSLRETAATLTALSPVVVAPIPLDRFARLFTASPRFAMAMFLSAQRERVALMDALARIGRTSSLQRLAGLLLDLHGRLSAAGLAQAGRFDLLLRQNEIGDVLGISHVHVNRVLRKLEKDGLIRRHQRQIEIMDDRALARLARWTHRPIATGSSWKV